MPASRHGLYVMSLFLSHPARSYGSLWINGSEILNSYEEAPSCLSMMPEYGNVLKIYAVRSLEDNPDAGHSFLIREFLNGSGISLKEMLFICASSFLSWNALEVSPL